MNEAGTTSRSPTTKKRSGNDAEANDTQQPAKKSKSDAVAQDAQKVGSAGSSAQAAPKGISQAERND